MKTLYLVTKPGFSFNRLWKMEEDDYAILIQDGVLAPPQTTGDYAMCEPDAATRNVKSECKKVSYSDIIEMSKAFDKTIVI